ncbi:hypothetical protein MBLNU459_g4443t1 [Dothideomycetes sp. NU459]
MPEKRPFGAAADGYENGDAKRARSNNGSPAPPALAAAHPTGESDLDRKKREAAERIAAIKARMPARGANAAPPAQPATASPSAPPAASSQADAVAARIAAMKARLSGAAASPSPSPAPAPASPAAPSPAPQTDQQARLQAQIAAIKARAAQNAHNAHSAPTRPSAPSPGLAPTPPVREDTSLKARGGLNVGLHPSLLGNAAKSDPSHQGKGKRRADQNRDEVRNKVNPYLADDAAQDSQRNDPNHDASFQKQRDRTSRQLLFNQKGKFIAQANALRQQERLEAMKRDMQEQARKAAIEQATEKSFLVPAPPDLEWWDEGLINGQNYENLDEPGKLNFDVITPYVQHPVLLAAPQESKLTALKPMYLTKTEQKKVRRQRRMADHKEEQAKIRLGLKAPPPPKVKKSNLMRVLGQEAVKDPTAVEARVNREIAQRAADHEAANEERMLTREQRHEKLTAQQEADAAKGIQIAVFKIDNLSYGKHRFQISKNAEQNNLTGITIFHPKMNLVIVEGGAHSVAAYKKLMLNRVKWTENAAPQSVREGNREADAEWLRSTDDRGMLKDLSRNKCTLVFEGEEKKRSFKYWNAYKACETDGEAKDSLSRFKMENMWTLAASMTDE